MPHMAPSNWLMLFIMFTMIFLMFNSLNYFSFNYPIKKTLIKQIKTKINWKW